MDKQPWLYHQSPFFMGFTFDIKLRMRASLSSIIEHVWPTTLDGWSQYIMPRRRCMTSPSSGNNWQERNSNSQNKELFGWKKKKCLFITHYSSFHNSVSYNSIFPKYFQNPVWHLKLSFVFNFKNSKTWNPPSDNATIVPQVYLLFYSFFLINKKKNWFFLSANVFFFESGHSASERDFFFFFLDLRWGFCESLEGCYGGHNRN